MHTLELWPEIEVWKYIIGDENMGSVVFEFKTACPNTILKLCGIITN